MLISILLAAVPTPPAPIDFSALDAAIERCERATVLPVFTAEPQRRSVFVTAVYDEQAAITGERLAVAGKRRALREAALRATEVKDSTAMPGESDQELALQQLALDDRQRALDDRRRLEAMRQEAIEVKRQYFLTRCPSGKKSD
jgi:hypothetical protein